MIDINKTDSEGLNAFWIAGRCGHGEIMQVLAEHGIDIFNKDKQGNTVLHTAARYPERKNILKMLLDSHFPTDITNVDGDTALHIAAQRNNKEAIELLLEAGAEIDALNNASLTPLYLAILNERSEESETAQDLLNAGAQVFIDGTDEQKDRSPIFLVIRRDQAKLLGVMYLHTQKAQEIKNSQGLTPLMYAAKNNNTKIVEFLTIASNTDLNQEDKYGCTILVHVLRKGGKEDLKMARKLVAGGADVNHVDGHGNTPLIQMINLGIRDSVKFLIDKGADQHICDAGGLDACDHAKRSGLAREQGFENFLACSVLLQRESKRRLEYRQQQKREIAAIQARSIDQQSRRNSRRSSRRSTAKVDTLAPSVKASPKLDSLAYKPARETATNVDQKAAKSPGKGERVHRASEKHTLQPESAVTHQPQAKQVERIVDPEITKQVSL